MAVGHGKKGGDWKTLFTNFHYDGGFGFYTLGGGDITHSDVGSSANYSTMHNTSNIMAAHHASMHR